MKKLNYYIIFVLPFLTLLIGCNKEGYKAPVSNTVEMSGRWWAELYIDSDGSGIPKSEDLLVSYADVGEYAFTTYNTAANDVDSVYVDDSHLWPFKIKAPVSLSNLTFTPSTVLNVEPDYLGSGETVTIVEGKILKGAGHAKSGRVADSIYLKLEFSDDAGTYYLYSGHRDSGQEDDQYH